MAFLFKLSLALLFSSLSMHAALGYFQCENLPNDVCAFSIASNGKRCVLETSETSEHFVEYQCRTSEVVADKMYEYIESDECVSACGVDRMSAGISSDALLDPETTNKLCSSSCQKNCHNIVDLYYNLAAGEGVNMLELCEAQRSNPHRAMLGLLSSGVAPGPMSDSVVMAPAPAPASI